MQIPNQVHLLPPPIPPPVKRVVLIDQDGLWRIAGTAEAQPPDLMILNYYGDEEPPVGFSLIRVTERSYIYREIVPPATGKLGEFHPDQV